MRQPFEPQNRAGPKARVLTRDRCFNIHWAEKDFFPCSLSFSLLFIPNPRSPSPGTSDSGGRGPVPPPPHPVPSSSLQPGARPWSQGCQSAAGCGGPSPQVDRGAPCRAASWSDLGLTPQTSAAPQRRQKRGLPPPPPLPTCSGARGDSGCLRRNRNAFCSEGVSTVSLGTAGRPGFERWLLLAGHHHPVWTFRYRGMKTTHQLLAMFRRPWRNCPNCLRS